MKEKLLYIKSNGHKLPLYKYWNGFLFYRLITILLLVVTSVVIFHYFVLYEKTHFVLNLLQMDGYKAYKTLFYIMFCLHSIFDSFIWVDDTKADILNFNLFTLLLSIHFYLSILKILRDYISNVETRRVFVVLFTIMIYCILVLN